MSQLKGDLRSLEALIPMKVDQLSHECVESLRQFNLSSHQECSKLLDAKQSGNNREVVVSYQIALDAFNEEFEGIHDQILKTNERQLDKKTFAGKISQLKELDMFHEVKPNLVQVNFKDLTPRIDLLREKTSKKQANLK